MLLRGQHKFDALIHVFETRIGELKKMKITLQLVDRFVVHPKGVFEDVLIKEMGFIIPIDFVILDFEEDQEVPALLGNNVSDCQNMDAIYFHANFFCL